MPRHRSARWAAALAFVLALTLGAIGHGAGGAAPWDRPDGSGGHDVGAHAVSHGQAQDTPPAAGDSDTALPAVSADLACGGGLCALCGLAGQWTAVAPSPAAQFGPERWADARSRTVPLEAPPPKPLHRT